jgi:hypothetical protein
MPTLRERALACALMVLGAAACGPPSRPGDDVATDMPGGSDGCGASCGEGGAGDAGLDGQGGADVPHADAVADTRDVILDVPLLPPACTMVGSQLVLADEMRVAPRQVFVAASPSGFVAGTVALRADVDNVYLTRISADGAMTGETNVSAEDGPRHEGGAFAPDGSGYAVVYSSNALGAPQVFLRRVGADGSVAAAAVQVSNVTAPVAAQDARIVPIAGGWLVTWRAQGLMGMTTLMAAPVTGSPPSVGAAQLVTPAAARPGGYELVTDGTRLAVVYVDRQSTTQDVYGVVLSATGAPSGVPVAFSAGGHAADSVGVTLRADLLTAVWNDPELESSIHAQQWTVSTGMLAAHRDLLEAGRLLSQPGLALDGTGFALAFRQAPGGVPGVGMIRYDSALAARDGVAPVSAATGGDAVRIAPGASGRFILGWADQVDLTGTRAVVQVARCP